MKEQSDSAVRQLDLSQPLELIVLGVKKGESARCRLTGKGDELTLRASGLYDVVPGEMVTITPKKHWIMAGHPYLSADIISSRFDLPSLGLPPLKLNPFGMWDPAEHYWGEEDETEQDWEREIKRCLHGYGLCLWRHSCFDEAAALFTRMLWLNPSDNQGARFNLEPIRAGSPWKERACS